jgi:hypothetical protein|tara:strand:- start:58967 stop:59182 length:216 start_codon:yes stop_codon:yes gene_type:complete
LRFYKFFLSPAFGGAFFIVTVNKTHCLQDVVMAALRSTKGWALGVFGIESVASSALREKKILILQCKICFS